MYPLKWMMKIVRNQRKQKKIGRKKNCKTFKCEEPADQNDLDLTKKS